MVVSLFELVIVVLYFHLCADLFTLNCLYILLVIGHWHFLLMILNL